MIERFEQQTPGRRDPSRRVNLRHGTSAKTVRKIQGFMADQYGSEVSAELISTVTEEVMAEVQAWQGRPLEPMYPVVFFDALRVKIRDQGRGCPKFCVRG